MKNKNNSKNIEKHFTASALIISKENKVVLLNHRKLGVWLYPGGHVNLNETPDETVIREVKEETGLDVEIISDKDKSLADPKEDVSVLHHPYAILCEKIPGNNKYHYHIDIIYLCKIINEEKTQLINNRRESLEVNLFSLSDLGQINLFPNFRKLLKKVLDEKR
jgi:ADP-ribose pyrophosphatase YjhB (NUDIX family)